MAHLNVVHLIGRLTRDPILKSTPSGAVIAEFGLATSKKYKAQDGSLKEEKTFVDVTCWNRLAENVNSNLGKGRLIYLGGTLKFDSWQDKDTGKTRSKLTVRADTVQFLDWPSDVQQDAIQHARETLSPPAGVMAGMPANNQGWKPQQNWEQPPMDEPPF